MSYYYDLEDYYIDCSEYISLYLKRRHRTYLTKNKIIMSLGYLMAHYIKAGFIEMDNVNVEGEDRAIIANVKTLYKMELKDAVKRLMVGLREKGMELNIEEASAVVYLDSLFFRPDIFTDKETEYILQYNMIL